MIATKIHKKSRTKEPRSSELLWLIQSRFPKSSLEYFAGNGVNNHSALLLWQPKKNFAYSPWV